MRNWTTRNDADGVVDIVILAWKRAAVLGCMALAAVAGLAGCKSSDTATEGATENAAVSAPAPVAASAPVAEPADARPLIVCFGDSLTAGYGADAGQSYPDHLQKLLDAQGYSYHVVNAGISGETTKDGLGRVARIAARHPKIVVLEFGGNDGLRGLPLEQTQSNLASMIETLQASGAQVALAGITLPPEYGPDYIAKINAIYPALAKKYHVRLLPFLLVDVYGKPGNMQEDGHHATAKGNAGVAVTVEKLIQPMLKK
jgi:acyl-CoA thioesterase-1